MMSKVGTHLTNSLIVVLILATIVARAAPAAAQPFNFCDFSNVSTLDLNNDASQQGNTLQLTPNSSNQRGSFFTNTQIPWLITTSFHTYYRFRFGPNATGGDGMAFVLMSGGSGSIGSSAGGLGYAGIGQSFAVEFDTFANGGGDPNGNHVAVLTNGNTTTHIASATPPFALTSVQDKYVWIDYAASTKQLDVYVALGPNKPPTALLSTTVVDLDAILGGNVRAGFTAATGNSTNQHVVLEWQMATDGFPCCMASPGGACPTALPVCGVNGLCVECGDDSDCGPGKPRCEKTSAKCVSCLTSADCAGQAPVCKGNACAWCSGSADCAGSVGGPVCAPNGACVACTNDTTCAAPTPKCDTAAHACVTCLSNLDCSGVTPACESMTQACVGCVDDSVCGGAKPVCDVTAKKCVAGCHTVSGNDSCGPGMMCDMQDGTIGACGPTSSSSSGMASSSSGMASSSSGGGAAGSGGSPTGTGGMGTGAGVSVTGTGGVGTGSGGSVAGAGGVGLIDRGRVSTNFYACSASADRGPASSPLSLAGAMALLWLRRQRRYRRGSTPIDGTKTTF